MPPESHSEAIAAIRASQRQKASTPKPLPTTIQSRDVTTGAWNAAYPDGSVTQGWKVFDADVKSGHDVRSLSLPSGLSAGEVAMLGPVGDPYPGAIPDQLQPRRVGDKAGPLKDNDVGYLKGQVWSYPEPKDDPKSLGFLMTLDSNFFEPTLNPTAADTLYAFISAFRIKSKTIYTRYTVFYQNFTNASPVAAKLVSEGYNFVEKPILESDGFYLCTLQDVNLRYSVEEIAKLKKNSEKYGVLYIGDWGYEPGGFDGWGPQNDDTLQKLKLFPRVKNELGETESAAAKISSKKILRRISGIGAEINFNTIRTNIFTGLKPAEIAAIDSSNRPVAALFSKLP